MVLLRRVLWNVLPFLIILLLFRIAFLLLYLPAAHRPDFTALAAAFAIGLRFDLATVTYLTLLPTLLLMADFSLSRRAGLVIFLITFSVFVFINIADIFYFAEAGKRPGIEVAVILHNWNQVFFYTLRSYWYVYGGFALTVFFLYRLWRESFWRQMDSFSGVVGWRRLAAMFLILPLAVLAMRGGFQSRPLKPSMAFQNENMFLGNLALNGTYTLMTTLYKRDTLPVFLAESEWDRQRLHKLVYSSREKPADPSGRFPFQRDLPAKPRPLIRNVVILVVESLGTYDLELSPGGKNLTPFLSSLAKKSWFFPRHYSLGPRTIAMFPAVAASLPAIFGQVYTTSAYQNNRLRSLPVFLKRAGYSSLFLYATKPGSMAFSTFAPLTGFSRVLTAADFPGGSDSTDGVWGVYDHLAWNRLLREMDGMNQPFLTMAMSLHPHDPFRLPAGYRPDAGQTPFERDLRYTDDSIRDFFHAAEKKSWYNETLFVILGDHGYSRSRGLDKYHTPLMFYHPGGGSPVPVRVDNRIASQLDIQPTLLDLLGRGVSHSSFGKSLLSPAANWAVMDFDSFTAWYQDDTLVTFSDQAVLGIFRPKEDPDLSHNLLPSADAARKKELLLNFKTWASAAAVSLLYDRIIAPESASSP